MADWFKFYENDLDNELLQWAMSENQPVGMVYVTILSRCCRDKSGTLAWGGEDFELFALSSKVHITPPIANECLKLLEKIRYIEIKDGFLNVLNWNSRQSEYCQKKEKVSRQCPDSVPTKSGECRLRGEESRGEESRSDLKLVGAVVTKQNSKGRNGVLPKQCDEEWLSVLQLSEAYRQINVPSEYSKMVIWCETKKKHPTRSRFLYWLNRCEKPMQSAASRKPF